MLIAGHFGELGRPRVAVRVVFPRLGNDAQVSFIVDTGADASLLSQADAETMGIDYSTLEQPADIAGVGGFLGVHHEEAILIFDDGSSTLPIRIKLGIAERGTSIAPQVPSLLGRDILDRARMVVDPARGELSLDFGPDLAW